MFTTIYENICQYSSWIVTIVLSNFIKNYNIHLIAVCCGILLSLFQIQHQSHIISDTFTYLSAAIHFQDDGLRAAFNVYPWPFYSILIAFAQKVTGLDMMASGHLVNIFFQSLLVWMFLMIVREFSRETRTLISAAVIILVYNKLNTLRPELLRDFAYWSMILGGLWALMRYLDEPQWRYALAWSGFSLLACAFRVEGFFLLLAMPLITVIIPRWTLFQRIKAFARLNLLLIASVIVVSLVLFANPDWHVGRAKEDARLISQFIDHIMITFNSRELLTKEYILPATTAKYAYILLLTGGLGVFIVVLCKALTPTYCFLTLYGLWQKIPFEFSRSKAKLLLGFILINLIICMLFFAWRYFIISRYLMVMNFGLLVLVSLTLSALFNDILAHKAKLTEKVFSVLICVGLTTMLLHSVERSFSSGYFTKTKDNYTHTKQAGLWLRQNINNNETLYTNDQTIAYYASNNQRAWLRKYNEIQFNAHKINHEIQSNNDTIYAVNIPAKQKLHYKLLQPQLDGAQKKFINSRGDAVYIITDKRFDN